MCCTNDGKQYLGIPLVAGCVTRYTVWGVAGQDFLERRFLPVFGLLSLLGLLYTIIVMFGEDACGIASEARYSPNS